MNEFEQIYGSHHDEDTWKRLSDRIDLFLSDNFGGDLSLRSFKDFLENDEQADLLQYLMEREEEVAPKKKRCLSCPEPFEKIIEGSILSPPNKEGQSKQYHEK